ncbi:Stearoyl-CoA desaturase 5 [Fragariocoptes setiger]|uniref:Stearoyl-CoA desaturase 5 n=1 Tax=Fragariocoptes setiger TaxID=1670756 RepID=A0ABQ7SCZ2_9ACAR|nr:Stearoyl-CoA desaturase 5 [Fragariocoptes setiger]
MAPSLGATVTGKSLVHQRIVGDKLPTTDATNNTESSQQTEKLNASNNEATHKSTKKQQDEHQQSTLLKRETTSAATTTLKTIHESGSGELVWRNIFLFVVLHSSIPIGIYMMWTQRPYKTMLYALLLTYLSALGVTAGAHRLWSHRSYKARWPVQVLLIILQTLAGQNSVYTWSRDHRVHHKFSETDADPHNIKRGFFFAHMGWLCTRKHPEVLSKGKLIDMSDLEANPYVAFQHKHFWWMAALFTVAVPTAIPCLMWNERFWTSFVLSFMFRYALALHGTWLVNSAAHYYGSRPYDEHIEARESPVVIYTGVGEGFHNYHHAFPSDYSTSEFGKYLNITTAFIDTMASIGLVYGRRKIDAKMILQRRARTGDLQAS